MINIINRLQGYLLCGFILLLPVFFLPLTSEPVFATQQLLTVGFIFLALVLYLASIIKTGRLNLAWNWALLAVAGFLTITGLSAVFSIAKYQSFWGTGFEPDTFLNIVLFCFGFFFLFQAAALEKIKKETFLKCFLLSGLLAAIIFLIQLIKPIFPWEFAKQVGFNGVGSVWALSLFFVSLLSALSLGLGFSVFKEKAEKIIVVLLGVLFLICLAIVNFQTSWIILLLVSIAGFFLQIWPNKNFTGYFKSKKNWLTILIVGTCLFMLFLGFAKNIVDLPGEANLSHRTVLKIAKQSVLSDLKNFALGTGPSTFAYNYDLYRPNSINSSAFWNIRFNRGSSVILDLLICVGFLAVAVLFFFLFLFFKSGWKRLEMAQKQDIALEKTIFAVCLSFLMIWFLYPANFVLLMLGFCFLGLGFGDFKGTEEKGQLKEINLFKNPGRYFITVCLCLAIFLSAVLGIYKISKNYLASYYFAKAQTVGEMLKKVELAQKAISLDRRDVYLCSLSQVFLNQAEVAFSQKEKSAQRTTQLQEAVSTAEKLATNARDFDSKNYVNVFNLGLIYGRLSEMAVAKAADSAIVTFDEASALAPQSPQVFLNKAVVLINAAKRIQNAISVLQKQADQKKNIAILQNQKTQILMKAYQELQRALTKKPNISVAYYYLGFIFEEFGKRDEAMQSYQMVLKIEPNNQEAQLKINALSVK